MHVSHLFPNYQAKNHRTKSSLEWSLVDPNFVTLRRINPKLVVNTSPQKKHRLVTSELVQFIMSFVGGIQPLEHWFLAQSPWCRLWEKPWVMLQVARRLAGPPFLCWRDGMESVSWQGWGKWEMEIERLFNMIQWSTWIDLLYIYDLFVTSFLCATMSIHCPSGQFGVMLCRVHTTDQRKVFRQYNWSVTRSQRELDQPNKSSL